MAVGGCLLTSQQTVSGGVWLSLSVSFLIGSGSRPWDIAAAHFQGGSKLILSGKCCHRHTQRYASVISIKLTFEINHHRPWDLTDNRLGCILLPNKL